MHISKQIFALGYTSALYIEHELSALHMHYSGEFLICKLKWVPCCILLKFVPTWFAVHICSSDLRLWQCDQIWRFVAILVIFGGVWRQFFCQTSPVPVHKSFDVDILGFGKFIYELQRQIWRFLPKCWRLFGLNTCTGLWNQFRTYLLY